MLKLYRLSQVLGCFLLLPALVFAQADITGTVKDAETKGALVGASVALEGTTLGAPTDNQGRYRIPNVAPGSYVLRVTFIGYETARRSITVGTTPLTVDFLLTPTVLPTKEVIVEVNRARERETPVAFSNIPAAVIEQRIHGQDAPLLVKMTPGVYAYSTDGVGNGEARVFVRGFDQNHVQVLINGIPTNDPESNAVYWSNWGAVSSAAASIQVQRGAGSSLYGAGAFGGSFNIVTGEAPARSFYGVNLSLGDPLNSMYGVDLNTGLLKNRFALALRVDRKVANGNRPGGRYEGVNYYTALSWYMTPAQTLKFVLHGAPQEHGYSFSGDISYFKKFGYDANPAFFLPKSLVNQLPNGVDGKPHLGLLDDRRELVDPDYVILSHNFFHKPQAELHYTHDLSERSSLRATLFYSRGRGGGSSVTGTASVPFNRRDANGVIHPDSVAFVTNTFLKNAFQRTSYSLHNQTGLLASYETQYRDFLRLTLGGEARYWWADHPGHVTNTYGKAFVTTRYAYFDTTGKILQFTRRLEQGDLKGPGDVGKLWGWGLAEDDPDYNTQYRNYRGKTPQFTLFGSGNWRIGKANILGTLQYVWYQYRLEENMPSENAIGRQLKTSPVTQEGPGPNGKFYMKDDKGNFYEFDLVRETRTRGFFQPKIGVNYNLTENLNAFGNFAHVERFVDLGVYYNQGRVDPEVDDEKSNQFEAGVGWQSSDLRAKVNGYYILWDNKSTRIQDITKAGQPGYDRNGFRTELIGSSRNIGVEFEMDANLNALLPIQGFRLRASATVMDHKWTDVLDKVLIDRNLGTLQEDTNLNGKLDAGEDTNGNGKLDENRRVFNSDALDPAGNRDALYFIELKDTPVASKPQTMLSASLNYQYKDLFAGLDVIYHARDIALDGGSYVKVDGDFVTEGGKEVFKYKYSDRLPDRAVVDGQVGYRLNIAGLKTTATIQVLNLFNKKYLADSDRFGVIPGYLRSFRFNLSTGI